MATHRDEEIIPANGIKICTDAFGNRDDPALLLIMGAGCSMIHWTRSGATALPMAGDS